MWHVEYEPNKTVIDRIDMREGWVCFLAAEPPPKPEEPPLYLSKAVAAWQKQNPMLTVGQREHDCGACLV